jgi:hypothetical protein
VPIAAWWVRRREREALHHGVPLTAQEAADARAAGVQHPEWVRLLQVDVIRTFEHPLLRALAAYPDTIFASTAGLTLRYGILVRNDCWRDRRLIVHELAHVAQYERLGGIAPFLRVYLRECLLDGYPAGALEQEAIRSASTVRREG